MGLGYKLRPVVGLRLEQLGGLAFGTLFAPQRFARGPFVQARMRNRAVLLHRLGIGQLCGQFQADAVEVEEVDALEDMVVGDAQYSTPKASKRVLVFSSSSTVFTRNEMWLTHNGVLGGGLCLDVVAQIEEMQ